MEHNNVFDEVKTYKDVKCIIEKNILLLYKEIPCQNILEESLKILINSNDCQEKRIIALSNVIDKNFSEEKNGLSNKEKKIPILLISIYCLNKYYDKVRLLSNTELILLCDYIYWQKQDKISLYIKVFGRKLLNYIHHKTNDYKKKEILLRLVYSKFDNNCDITKFNEEMVEYVRNMSIEKFNIEYELLKQEEEWI